MSSCIFILIILDILGLQIGWVIIVLISTGISQSNCRRHLRNITVRLGLTCKTWAPVYKATIVSLWYKHCFFCYFAKHWNNLLGCLCFFGGVVRSKSCFTFVIFINTLLTQILFIYLYFKCMFLETYLRLRVPLLSS